MSEPHRWTPADVREEYFRLYGPGQVTTLLVLVDGRKNELKSAEAALRALAARDPRVVIQQPLSWSKLYFKIERG